MFMMSVAGLVLLAAAVVVASPPCPKGHGFWDMNRQKCAQCTVCSPSEVVLLPCQPYKDTVCGPISALNLNWPWQRQAGGHAKPVAATSTAAPPTTRSYFSTRKMRPLARKVTMLTKSTPTSSTPSTPNTPAATPGATEAATEATSPAEVVATSFPTSPSTTEAFLWTESSSESPTTKVSAQPFLAAETALEWDWQALALAVTIATFVVLLVIFAVYAAVHARRATLRRRRIQKELDAAQLSLFPVTNNAAEVQMLGSPSSPKGMYNANQCLYLEKLLEQKQTRRANIYVETGRQATPAPARRSSRWKEKPTPARTPC